MEDEIKLTDSMPDNVAHVSGDNYLMCKDLSKWASGLLPIMQVELRVDTTLVKHSGFMMMLDVDTKQKFLIARVGE